MKVKIYAINNDKVENADIVAVDDIDTRLIKYKLCCMIVEDKKR